MRSNTNIKSIANEPPAVTLTVNKVSPTEANLMAIIENADAFVYSLDREFRYVTFNSKLKATMKELYGIVILAGEVAFGFLEERDYAEARQWEKIYREALSGKPVKIVKDYTRNYIPNYTSFSINPIWEEGKVIGLSCFAFDVTKQKMSEDALKASEQRYRHLTHNPLLGINWVSAQGKVLNANQTFCNMLGYKNIELIDKHFSQFTHVGDHQKQQQILQSLFSGEISSSHSEKRYVTKTGNIMWGELTMSGVKNADGEVKYVIGVVQDITARKKAEAEIVTLNESLETRIRERTNELEMVNRDLEAFAYSVSHDLRSPLKVINGYSSVLLKNHGYGINSDGTELLQGIKCYTQKMAGIIDSLLNLSRISRTTVVKQHRDMRPIVETALAETRLNNGEVAQIVLNAIAPAVCDAELIKQVWVNLISNAVKYSGKTANPQIQIGSHIENGELAYYIKDNGVGFDMPDAEKLFGVFQRLHNATDFEGTGVGLNIAYRIITRHGGRIWAQSKANQGATFYFTLPNAS